MLIDDDYRRRVDSMIRDHALSLDLERAPRLHDRNGPDDGAFELALGSREKAWVKGGMRMTGADRRFDRTLGQITAGQFSPQDIGALKERALDAAEWGDVKVLSGIQEGRPVLLQKGQKATIDRILGKIGSDELANRARVAYGQAMGNGQIKVR